MDLGSTVRYFVMRGVTTDQPREISRDRFRQFFILE
jgi:hypothetical protein